MALRPLLLVAGATLLAACAQVSAVAAVVKRVQRMLDLTNPVRAIASPQLFHQRHCTHARLSGDPSLLARANYFLQVLRAKQCLLQCALEYRPGTILLADGEWRWPVLSGH